MIDIDDVHKTFGARDAERQVHALRGASLTIREPGFYGIMGPSGSGKSTLMHLMGGLDRPDRGRIVVNDAPVHELDERALTQFRRTQIGIVFQQFNLIPTMTALHNVSLPGLLDGKPESWLNERATELLTTLGLAERAQHRPDAMSGGEQQRVAIARALLFEPRVLLADEPTGNLDSQSSQQIWQMLADLAKSREMTVVMVTHEPAAAAYCDRVFVLRDGVVCGELEVTEHDAGWMANRYQQLVG